MSALPGSARRLSAPQPPFDLGASLPAGVTVLEASAGTGKTYAIAGLTARFVAEGVPLERILLVTFTRMATGELRERVRERLISVERCLRSELAGGGGGDDPVVVLLRGRGHDAVASGRRRLAQALSDFDSATIATTHGFCQEALGGLGIAADVEPDVAFVEDLSDLVTEVLDDLYVRRFHRHDQVELTRAQALAVARIAIENPLAEVAPASGEVGAMRRRLAQATREELEERKRRLSVMTYDDLLMRLRSALAGEDGEAVAARLRERYEYVLVDEFQDTDPVQWEIMRWAFAHGTTMVLIADPKQAIYAFRGADVYAYLEAAEQAGELRTLTDNRRSDQRLLDAYDALFHGVSLGHEGIEYRQVRAATATAPPRLHGTPLRVRLVAREDVERTPSGFARVAGARRHVAEDLAADVVRLLDSDAEVAVRGGARSDEIERVSPGHVAALVRTNAQAAMVMRSLQRVGVPAVMAGAGSVFATEGAEDWRALLEALERPASVSRAHAVALTPFVGWTAERVAEAAEAEWGPLHERLHEWARVLRERGVASLLETVTHQQGLPERVLAVQEGERRLTDLRHIGQLLHTAASSEQLGTTALTGWLRRRITEAGHDGGDEERSRRLESDAQAVQVLTIHRSKGLEFPIVYVPFLWEPGWIPRREPIAFHDPAAGHRRTIDVACQGAEFDAHHRQYVIEQRGEDLRLAYVALTRARHQAVVWWAGTWDSRDSPLGRLLFARAPDGSVAPDGPRTPSDEAVRAAFETLSAQGAQDGGPTVISVEPARLGRMPHFSPPLLAPTPLKVARFDRTLDLRWRRTSYSDITAATHELRVASEPEEPVLADEPSYAPALSAGAPDAADGARLAAPSGLTELPMGVAAGTLVHQALEAADFAAADLRSELTRALESVPGRRTVTLSDPEAVASGLAAALETPLGPLVGDVALRDVERADRLDELGFELPLAGGDAPLGWVTLDAVAAILRERLPAGDPMREYARRLDDPALRQSVRGYLTGSLDLVVRLPGPRFAVIDYKTNWLAAPEEGLTAWHYRPQAVRSEMQQRHYGLQALLYLVALHRYLRWRLPGYEPERHLAGVLYLFLRGMSGPETPVVGGARCGVFAWGPPAGLVQALSDALHRGGERAA